MTTPDVVLARLQGPALDQLATLVVDFLLSRRVRDLIDPAWFADQVVLALDAVTSSPQAEARIRERILTLRELVPEGKLGQRLPSEIAQPLREVLQRPYAPDRDLIGRLLEHPAFEQLIRDVLVDALMEFTHKLRSSVGKSKKRLGALSKGMGRFGRSMGEGVLGNLQEGVLGGLSHEIEARAETRIRDFVEGAISSVVSQVADHLCQDTYAQRYGDMRAHALDVMLDTENTVLVGEFYKLHPDDLVDTATAVARALTGRQSFRADIAGMIEMALDAAGDRSLADIIAETGLDQEGAGQALDTFRGELAGLIAERGRELVATPEFEDWLGRLLA